MSQQETEAQKAAIKHLGDVLSVKESQGNYKAWNSGTIDGNIVNSGYNRDMSGMTIDQLIASGRDNPASSKNRIFAAGKYQITTDDKNHQGGTLGDAKRDLGLRGDQKFTNAEQEVIFENYLLGPKKAPDAYAYIHRGASSLVDAIYDISKIWRSVPVPQGKQRGVDKKKRPLGASDGSQSYDATNKASRETGTRVADAVEKARAAFGNTQPVTTTKQPTKAAQPRDADGYRGYQLTGNVGTGGENKHDDVIAVQTRLGFFGISTKADGKLGPDTIKAIHAFQGPFGIHDGLIEVGQRSAKELFSGQITVSAKLDTPTQQTTQTTKQTTTKQPQTEKPDASGVYWFGKYRSSHPAGGRPGKQVTPKYAGPISHQASFGSVPVRSNVKLTPAIVRTATVLAPYLPRGTQMTSGLRDDEDQARVIMGLHAPVANDVYKTWLAAVGARKKVNWVGESNHRPGKAMDFSGAPLGAIDAAVKKCKAEHAEAKIKGTLPEQGNNCLHVNVDD